MGKFLTNLLLVAVFLFGGIGILAAQNGTIKGNVSDDAGGLISATIKVKGSSIGTISDFDGNYSLMLAPGKYVVEASYVGYETQSKEVSIKGGETVTLDFNLSEGLGLDEVLVVGSRAAGRTKLTTAVPVDVVDIKKLAAAGAQTNINQILNYVAPSFSSNTQTISDGTDHIDPASLRGLGPDQVLVLINGKRRHTSSLVNVNGTFGRGNVGTDLNAIPVSSIERIEVLRDGAAAQYGSDAIAGVINIVLNKSVNIVHATVTTGAYSSTGSNDFTGGLDGKSLDLSLDYGLPLGKKGGFINFAGNFENRDYTSRMKEYNGKIFQAFNGIERLASADGKDVANLTEEEVRTYAQSLTYLSDDEKSLIMNASDEDLHNSEIGSSANPLKNDVTEEELSIRGLQRSDFNMRVGQSALRGGKFMMNMSLPIGENAEIYAFGGLGHRAGNSAGFYRLPYQNRTLTYVYPNGFLPEINSIINDKSMAVGIKGKLANWTADFSNTYGINSFRFLIKNTSNASLGKATPFEFDAGGFSFAQNTTNFDLNREYDVLSGLNVALGAEYRVENYSIDAGNENSWASYDIYGEPVTYTTPSSERPTDWFGAARPGGAQVFPGFRPSNQLSEYRNSVAAYVDVEADVTDAFLLGLALRTESYSDFGNTLNWKAVARYKVTNDWTVRGAASTGFRAPSLHQKYYNSTSTLFVDGVPFEVGTFSNSSRIARILGIPKLKEETSTSYSLGLTGRIPDANLSVTIDGYLVGIKDRVVLTGTFKPGDDEELQRLFAEAGSEKATFFANAIDTKSKGIDVVITHLMNFGESSLKTSLAGTFSQTRLDGDIHVSEALKGKESTYFDETNRIYLEEGVPHTKVNLSMSYKMHKFSVFARGVYFGEVTNATNTLENQQVYSPRTIFDLSLGYDFSQGLNFTIGANNILDTYPDENIEANQSSGRFLYSRRAQQFGFMGRYIFGRLSFKF